MRNQKVVGLVAIASLFAIVGCSPKTSSASAAGTSSAASSVAASSVASSAADDKIDLAMITDVGNIDDGSFNQFTYEGVKDYASKNNLKQSYFKPTEDSKQARIDSINQAIAKGAKVVVCPGYLFETAIYDVQDANPTVNFLLLDGEPHTDDYKTYKTGSNVHNILYKEQEAGYLAGYAVVKEGYRSLGFMGGMSVPAVEKYGFGYVSGIIDAAAELKLTSKIAIQYDYAGTFSPSDTIVTNTTSWYNAGTEAIFSCGGSIFKSISAAAIATSKKVIGVDVDQYSQAPSVVITSAEKKLQASTEAALDAFYKNNKAWPTDYAGKTALVGAKEGMVGIPTTDASWKFTTFTKTDYQTIFDKLVASATYTGVTYDSTNGVKLAANHTATDYVTITYGSGVTNKPVAIA